MQAKMCFRRWRWHCRISQELESPQSQSSITDPRMINLPPPDLPPPTPVDEKPVISEVVPAPLTAPVPPVFPGHEEPETLDAAQSLKVLLWEALAYPLRGDSWGMLLMGAAVVFCIAITAFVPLAGWVVMIGGTAYVAAYYFEIINHTLAGKDDVPAWPDLSSYWDDIVIPGVQMLGIAVLSYMPAFAVLWLVPDPSSEWHDAGLFFSRLFNWIYFPMATLAVVCSGTLWAALPHRVVPAIYRVIPGYLVCAAAFAVAELGRDAASSMFGWLPVIGFVLPWILFMYCMLVQARLTGLIYLRYRDRLTW